MSIESTALDLVRVEIKELKNYGINLAFAYENLKKQHNALIDCIHRMVTTNDSIYTLMSEINAVLVKNGNKPMDDSSKVTEEISLETQESQLKEIKKENKLTKGSDLLNSDIELLKLPYGIYCNLKFDKIFTIGKLTQCTVDRIMKIKGVGSVSLIKIKNALSQHGLRLAEKD